MAIFGNEDATHTRVQGTSGSGNAGTTVLKTGPGHLFGVYAGVTTTGTTYYYDSPTGTGTSATNQIAAVANNGTKIPDFFAFQTALVNGLTVVTSVGTTDQTVFWN